ncbi:DNA-binding IclR family transcriptional regulator [Aurantimonas endophytica]|uniref:DNA-binding IclR family transcriptional regulator n=1 Tax=Aurantimonas endophytica TaxID=1522175 RepID=A0A7W6HC93_9HYPH|nr:IclR family transcriptional regulator [Aurantimonas endophytica]MBB4002575.1 DNA-binding IclR family transcriptional regulator [Aurantimonas endophytica]MCO6403456.1 helix-turn-helix domain-containing protein [Aurantimonas endophytica]
MASVKRQAGTPQAGVESVDRALALLACFDEGDHSLSLAELATRTGFYKSTILRLCASLESAHYLVRLEDKSFAIGPEVLRLGSIFQKSLRIEDRIRPVLRRLLETIGESASFFRREGDRRICLFREDSAHSVRDHVVEGERLPLAMGAAGHVLTRFDRGDGKSPATPEPSMALPLFSFGERDPEIAAAAVPIFGWRRGEIALLGALAVSGPVSRFTPELVGRIRISLLDEGRELSAQLGGPYETAGIASGTEPDP